MLLHAEKKGKHILNPNQQQDQHHSFDPNKQKRTTIHGNTDNNMDACGKFSVLPLAFLEN